MSKTKKNFRHETNNPLMFDEKESVLRYGELALSEYYSNFKECENFLFEEMTKYQTGVTFDMAANEQPFFSTIGYTNFSEMFSLKTLSHEINHLQIKECFVNPEPIEIDFFTYFKNKYLDDKKLGKYLGQKTEISVSEFESVVVLPGGNKMHIVCGNKIKHILKEHGTKAIFKLHPLTSKKQIEDFINILPAYATVISGNECLYEYIKQSEIVYTTHSSESAFLACCMGKKISPIDAFQYKNSGTFAPISDFLFNYENTDVIINKIFNNYRSGIFHPILDKNWKEKMTKYLEWIHKRRAMMKNSYFDR